MKVILATHMGMCFGVRDAIVETRKLTRPSEVTIHGELVHNARVLAELRRRGFPITGERNRSGVPGTRKVLITAHGISDRERGRLQEAGKTLIDTTCPLVKRVHEAARELAAAGFGVILVGKRGHVEVEGIIGDLETYVVVEEPEDVREYPWPKLGVVCQSTTPPFKAQEVLQAIVARNPGKEIRLKDTICRPTKERQEAALELLDKVEALVVVGGRNSNNTRQLGNLAESRGIPWKLMQSAADLDREWLLAFEVVGLTAGTSTPDEVIREVYHAMLSLDIRQKARTRPVENEGWVDKPFQTWQSPLEPSMLAANEAPSFSRR